MVWQIVSRLSSAWSELNGVWRLFRHSPPSVPNNRPSTRLLPQPCWTRTDDNAATLEASNVVVAGTATTTTASAPPGANAGQEQAQARHRLVAASSAWCSDDDVEQPG